MILTIKMCKTVFSWVLYLFSIFHCSICATNTDFKDFLSGTEYTNYNKNIFPIETQASQLVVSMKYSLINLDKLDETLGQIKLVGIFEASWTNDLLKGWTYDIDEMILPQNNLWKPPLTIHNTVETLQGMGYRTDKVKINKAGTHTWKVGIVSTTSCAITLSHYPFDKHTCSLEFTPWGYMEDQIKLENSTMDVDLSYFTENVQWTIESTSIEPSTVNGASFLTFKVKIARRPGNVLINYALPVLVLSILSSLAYMMPAESGERVAYSVVSFLTLVIHITMIADNIPRSSSPITILSLFLTLMLLMSSLNIAISTLTLRVYAQEEATVIPLWLRHATSFLKCQKGKRCCKRSKKKKPKRSESSDDLFEESDSSDENDDESMDGENLDWDEMSWNDVGNVLDWAFFLLFLIATIIIAIFFYFPLAFVVTD